MRSSTLLLYSAAAAACTPHGLRAALVPAACCDTRTALSTLRAQKSLCKQPGFQLFFLTAARRRLIPTSRCLLQSTRAKNSLPSPAAQLSAPPQPAGCSRAHEAHHSRARCAAVPASNQREVRLVYFQAEPCCGSVRRASCLLYPGNERSRSSMEIFQRLS